MTSGAPEGTGAGGGALAFKAAVDGLTAAVERLATAPYGPPWPDGVDPGRSGAGADFAVVALRVSQDFYADGAGEEAGAGEGGRHAAVTDAYETELWGVVLALDARWGTHRSVGTADRADRYLSGEPVEPFHATLFDLGYFGDLRTWRVGGRLVAVGVGQQDAEEPVVLFGAVRDARPGRDGTGDTPG
ncbi:hypothetical protein OG875_11200 [Streptomyces sp. NBC_01498]|uniref:hypothetical protein n=1 Tax=Streptomyces sp. NBC_01498 TaxID=2975870 RepID=UPI002E7B868B|nr:hypothetical protein [Streptomyces sp. NBC_01498]WTL25115.1 hypothetical protein OG875_11200 [Streptomyces sp. NBC_01498]